MTIVQRNRIKSSIVGRTLIAVTAEVEALGGTVRVTKEDCEEYLKVRNFVAGRFDVEVENGVIVRVE